MLNDKTLLIIAACIGAWYLWDKKTAKSKPTAGSVAMPSPQPTDNTNRIYDGQAPIQSGGQVVDNLVKYRDGSLGDYGVIMPEQEGRMTWQMGMGTGVKQEEILDNAEGRMTWQMGMGTGVKQEEILDNAEGRMTWQMGMWRGLKE